MKKLSVFLVMLILSTLPQFIYAESSDTFYAPNDLIDEAVRSNPELRSFQERIHAYEQRPSQTGSLDDPMLKLSIANLPVDSFRFDREAMTQKQISLTQKFPFPGKLGLKEDIANKEIEAAQEEYNEKKNSLIMQVKVLCNELLFLKKAIDITNENRSLLSELIRTAETKYAVGQGAQQEIVQAQIKLSYIIKQMILLEQREKTAAARLQTLLNRPLQDRLNISGELTQTSAAFNFDDLQKTAETSNPALILMKHKIDQARLSLTLTEKEYYPDMEFGVSYGQRDDSDTAERPDFFSASIAFNIPLWYKNKENRKVLEEKADERRAIEQYRAMKNDINFQLSRIKAELDMYRQEIEISKTGLIPQSVLSFESAMSGYEVDKLDFLTLINDQIQLFNFKIEFYRAVADHENSLAELEKTVGRPMY